MGDESEMFRLCRFAKQTGRPPEGKKPENYRYAILHNLSGEPDLNWRPLPWQGSVLPLNYRREHSEQGQALLTADLI